MPSTVAILSFSRDPQAAYCAQLADSLRAHYTVEIITLNEQLLKDKSRRARRHIADHLQKIVQQLNLHSCVLLDIDLGKFGGSTGHARRHLLWLLNRLRSKTLFLLSQLPADNFSLKYRVHDILSQRRHRWRAESRTILSHWQAARNSRAVWKSLLAQKNSGIACFNPQKLRLWRRMYNFTHGSVVAPAFFTHAERAQRTANAAALRRKLGFADGDTVIATVGDTHPHDGLKTLIRSFAMLPDNYKLLICGNRQEPAAPSPALADPARMRFCGFESIDLAFDALAAADAAVFCEEEIDAVSNLYLTAAAELNGNLFLSYNLMHREFETFHPGKIIFFDVGNPIELAQKLSRLCVRAAPVSAQDAGSQAAAFKHIIDRLISL